MQILMSVLALPIDFARAQSAQLNSDMFCIAGSFLNSSLDKFQIGRLVFTPHTQKKYVKKLRSRT